MWRYVNLTVVSLLLAGVSATGVSANDSDRYRFFIGTPSHRSANLEGLANVGDIDRDQFGFVSDISRDRAMFRLGASAAMLEVQLKAGDRKRAVGTLTNLETIFATVIDTNDDVFKMLRQLKEAVANGPHSASQWTELTSKIRRVTATPEDEAMFSIGAWISSSRALVSVEENDVVATTQYCLNLFKSLAPAGERVANLFPPSGAESLRNLITLSGKKEISVREAVAARKAVLRLYELMN